jgi:hypothetical protein
VALAIPMEGEQHEQENTHRDGYKKKQVLLSCMFWYVLKIFGDHLTVASIREIIKQPQIFFVGKNEIH